MSDTLIPKFIPLYPLLLKDYGIVEAGILGYLDFFQCNNKNFNCTNEDLSKILNVSEATIKRSLKNLIKKWEIIVSKKFREWGWQLRIISIAQNGLLQRNNLSFSKGSNWAFHNIYNNKEQKELKESGICSVNELLEWYKNHLLLPRMITDISLVKKRAEYKQSSKARAYTTVDWFTQQLVVYIDTVRYGSPRWDTNDRFSFALNQTMEWKWKQIVRDEKVEWQYQAWKRINQLTQKQNE